MVADGRHAVVIGSGISGLLAARVLLGHFERVTIVDRDRFPQRPDHRGGVPQSWHVHGLLPRGAQIIYELFPGLHGELRADGAAVAWDLCRAKIVTPAGLLPLAGELDGFEDGMLFHSRFLLEWRLRQRLSADARVRFSPATEVVGLSTSRWGSASARGAVSGVRVRYRDTSAEGRGADRGSGVLDADLVVDASGRSSHAPEWIEGLGYGRVGEETVHSQLSYASRFYARPDGFPDEFSLLLINGRPPDNPRAGLVQDIENGVWHVTLGGMAGAVVPTDDEEEFLRWARELPDPRMYEAIRVARPLTPLRGWRTPSNRLRHFERLRSWPPGLIVTGDAVCALNPIYGQGMTVAAIDALALRDCLLDYDSGRRPGFEKAFQRRLARTVAGPWLAASSEDLRWPTVTMDGARPRRGTTLVRRYLDVVLRAAVEDPVLARRYFDVIGIMAPPTSLFSPAVAVRVALDAGRRVAARLTRRRTVPECPFPLTPGRLVAYRGRRP